MRGEPNQCPFCKNKPSPFRRWHDKVNRGLNHLKWEVVCRCGKVHAMGHTRREAVHLYNGAAASYREEIEATPAVARPSSLLRRFLRAVLAQ